MGHLVTVDLNRLPRRRDLGDGFDYPTFAVTMLGDVIPVWQRLGFIKDPGNASWGGFVANPLWAGRYHLGPLEDPYQFIGTVFGDGPEWLGYSLNAARKGKVLAEFAREHDSTKAIRRAFAGKPELLGVSAESAVSARDLRWMQFVYGGAVLVGEGSDQRLWGISFADQDEDHGLATLLGESAGTTRRRS